MALDLRDEKTLRRLLLVVLVIACVLVAALVGVLTRNDDKDDSSGGATHTTPTPSASASPSASPSPSKSAVPKEAEDVAKNAVLAYTQYAYTDSGPEQWLERLRKYATVGLYDGLKETFGNDQDAEWQWKSDIVPNQEQTRTKIGSVDLDTTFHESTAKQSTYLVTYTKSVKRKGTDWTTPTQQLSLFVTVDKQKDGTWKASDIVLPQPTG